MGIYNQLIEMSISDMLQNERLIDDMIDYFSRQNDHNRIRDNIKTRYGLAIKHEKDPNNTTPDSYTESYGLVSDEAFEKQVNSGIIGAISLGFGQKVVGALATMFTEPGQVFKLKHDSIENPEDADELLNEKRRNGGFLSAITDADRQSIQCGSSAVFLYFYNGQLKYQKLAPSSIRAFFMETVKDSETGEERLTDRTNIEDATAVMIRLGQVDLETWRYLAIFGASDLPGYENGRHVWFQAGMDCQEIPDIGHKDAHDYKTPEGVLCNPLTYFGLQNPDMELPEYPIAIIDGGITDEHRLMPVTTSLYEDSIEIDTAASHLLSTSQDAARGTLVFNRDNVAASQPLPTCHSGAIALPPGMTAERLDYDAKCQETAMDTLNTMMQHLAAGYGVPDYMVVSNDEMFNEASGVALMVKTRPLKKARALRVELNRPAVSKIFEIEQGLIGMFFAEEDGVAQLLECEQVWESGDLIMPENKKEEADRIALLKKEGVLDEISAIQEYYQYPTEEEAIAHYEKLKERAKKYPPLREEAQPMKPIGLKGRALQNGGQNKNGQLNGNK